MIVTVPSGLSAPRFTSSHRHPVQDHVGIAVGGDGRAHRRVDVACGKVQEEGAFACALRGGVNEKAWESSGHNVMNGVAPRLQVRLSRTIMLRIRPAINRRDFLTTPLAAGALTALAAAVGGAEAPAVADKQMDAQVAPPDSPTVYVQGDDAVSITWGVHELCTGSVEYGPTEGLGLIASGSVDGLRPLDDTVISVLLKGLTPGQRIYYRAVTAPIHFPNHYKIRRGEAIASPVLEFTLPSATQQGLKLAVWNDTHEQAETLAALREATAVFAPDVLLINGDVPKDQFMHEKDLANGFLNSARNVVGRWPVIFVRGNHDTRGLAARSLPRFSPKPRPEGYVNVLRYGPLGIIVLDTGEDKDGAATYGGLLDFVAYRQVQRQWLERAVAEPRFADAPFRLVFCHIPLRWKDPANHGSWCADGDSRWSRLLGQAKVHAVISGHTHEYWHDAPTPARPFHQVTGGGPQLHSTAWSPTPATITQVVVEKESLSLRVLEIRSGKEHLHLQLSA